MKLHLNVTQEDIDNGIPNNSEACPIACAVRRELTRLYPDKYQGVEMDDRLNVYLGYEYYYSDEPELVKFVRDYDEMRRVKPFEMELDLSDPQEWAKHEEYYKEN